MSQPPAMRWFTDPFFEYFEDEECDRAVMEYETHISLLTEAHPPLADLARLHLHDAQVVEVAYMTLPPSSELDEGRDFRGGGGGN